MEKQMSIGKGVGDDASENQIIIDLKAGKMTAVPTETVEGYAVSLSSMRGIRELMVLKERGFDSGKVFTLVPESKEAIARYALVPELARKVIQDYLPGELTLILPRNPKFRHFYYNHFDSIGIRIPDYPIFDRILAEVGPVLLTSANPRGGTPRSFTGHLPSTIIDFTSKTPKVVRQGELKLKF